MVGNKARVLHSQLDEYEDEEWTEKFAELTSEQMDEEIELLDIQYRLDDLENTPKIVILKKMDFGGNLWQKNYRCFW